MRRHDRVTIKEIAQITGVSVQTVSRVINNRPDVSPETRAAIEAAITEYGFQPSALARSLVSRRSQLLGVIAAGLKYFGVAQTLNGVAEEAEASGYSIILKELASFEVPDIVPVVELLIAQHVEGIIFAPPELGTNIRHVRDQLPRSSPPVVFLKADATPGYTTIGIDNIHAARLATEHLLALGRKRVGHIAGPIEWREAGARREGWVAALSEAGLERGPVVSGDWSAASGARAMEELLDTDPAIDAVFSANDEMALGALHVLHDRRIAVPDQIAMVGFDAVPESRWFIPSLTTVSQPLQEVGRIAVREIVRALEADSDARAPRDIRLLPELIIGDSAPRPARSAPADGAAPAKLRAAGVIGSAQPG